MTRISSLVPLNLACCKNIQFAQSQKTPLERKKFNDFQALISEHIKFHQIETGSRLGSRSYKKEGLQQTPSIEQPHDQSILILNNRLIKAIVANDITTVKTLIDAGANPNVYINGDLESLNAVDKYQTVLMLAARHGNADITNTLIAAGANVNDKGNIIGRTALMAAATEGRADIVKILIDAGANIEARDYFEKTALINAAEKKASGLNRDGIINAVRVLIAEGADVNATSFNGLTPLMNAAASGYVNMVKELLAAGANINAIDQEGRTALDWSELYGNLDVYRILTALKK